MKKAFSLIAAAAVSTSMMAGGLVTNTNHSAYMVRILSRQASTGVDATYFNPAGLTKLNDGFHFSLNNQVIGQTKTITNDYYFLTEKPTEYIGNVSAPIFPGVYAVFKRNKVAISFGFNPVGGGGGAEFPTGLPSFEMGISELVPKLATLLAPLDQGVVGGGYPDPGFRNVTAYDADIYFKGTSIYFGYQANLSYELNDMVSVAVGARYVTANNSYQGSISNVKITAAPAAYTGLASPYNDSPGNYLRDIAETAVGASSAALLNGAALLLDSKTNVEADVAEKGTGVTPIISMNITPVKMFNISLKYEFKTMLELTTTVYDNKDGGGMFVDKATKVADMPATASVGLGLHPMKKLYLTAGMNYYFDKNNDYDGSTEMDIQMIDKNFFDYSFGVEYAFSNMVCISAGYAGTQTGVNDAYNSDLRYSLNTSTFGGGFGFSITPMIDVNIGGMYTKYDEGGKTITPTLPVAPIHETYNTETWVLGFGVDLHF
jgi:long-subunit fatty acid transport protein